MHQQQRSSSFSRPNRPGNLNIINDANENGLVLDNSDTGSVDYYTSQQQQQDQTPLATYNTGTSVVGSGGDGGVSQYLNSPHFQPPQPRQAVYSPSYSTAKNHSLNQSHINYQPMGSPAQIPPLHPPPPPTYSVIVDAEPPQQQQCFTPTYSPSSFASSAHIVMNKQVQLFNFDQNNIYVGENNKSIQQPTIQSATTVSNNNYVNKPPLNIAAHIIQSPRYTRSSSPVTNNHHSQYNHAPIYQQSVNNKFNATPSSPSLAIMTNPNTPSSVGSYHTIHHNNNNNSNSNTNSNMNALNLPMVATNVNTNVVTITSTSNPQHQQPPVKQQQHNSVFQFQTNHIQQPMSAAALSTGRSSSHYNR